VRRFYTSTSKQIHEIHEEARRIADEHKAAASSTQAAGSASAEISGAPDASTEKQPTPTA